MKNRRIIVAGVLLAVAFIVLILVIVGYGNSKNKEDEIYTYNYEIDGKPHIMSIKYFDDVIYGNEPYEGATATSEGSPDWGIRVNFENQGEFLYFYESHSPGGINPAEESADMLETIQVGNQKVDVMQSGDFVFGNCLKKPYYGVVFCVNKENWTDYRDMIISLIQSAEAE